MLDILDDPATTGVVIVATPEEMPVNETIELVERLGDETDVDLAAVVVNRVLPELFGRGEEEIFERLREPGAAPPPWPAAVGGPVEPVLDAAELAVTPAPDPGRAPRPPARPGCPRASPLLYVPELFTREPRRARHPPDGRGPRRGAGLLMAPRRRDARRAGHLARAAAGGQGDRDLAAARAAWARPPPRPPPAAMAAAHLGGKVLVLTVDPARRLANALGPRGVRQRRDPGAARGVRRRRRRAPRRAVGGDARHQAVVGRPGAPPRPRRRDPRRHPRQPALPEHHRPVRAEPRLHRHGAALRDPRVGPLRPDRRRHAADPERHRLPRGARAHGRLLLQPAAALADAAVPSAGSSTLASKPFYQVADRILGSQFLEDIAEFFILFQTMYDGFVERAEAVDPDCCATGARRSWWSPRSRRRRCARPSSSSTRCAERKLHLGALVLNKVLPDVPARPARRHGRGRRPVRRRRRARRRGWPTALGDRADAVGPGAARGGRELPQLPGGGQAGGRAAGRAGVGRPRCVATVPYFETDIYDLAGLLVLGESLWR